MPEHATSRTLVKSAPELWVQCSDAALLARHLGAFGEIRITKLEPETAVAWEGDDVRGTVTLESSGWGTRVTLTAVAPERVAEPTPAPTEPAAQVTPEPEPVAAQPEPAPVAAQPEPEPVAAQPEPAPTGFWGRLRARLGRGRGAGAPAPKAEAVAEPAPSAAAAKPEPAAGAQAAAPAAVAEAEPAVEDELTILTRALDSLGRAHHRPYSREEGSRAPRP